MYVVAEPTDVSLAPATDKAAEGVLTVTVLDEKDTPVAERLVYRMPAKSLNISVTADKKTSFPGDIDEGEAQ